MDDYSDDETFTTNKTSKVEEVIENQAPKKEETFDIRPLDDKNIKEIEYDESVIGEFSKAKWKKVVLDDPDEGMIEIEEYIPEDDPENETLMQMIKPPEDDDIDIDEEITKMEEEAKQKTQTEKKTKKKKKKRKREDSKKPQEVEEEKPQKKKPRIEESEEDKSKKKKPRVEESDDDAMDEDAKQEEIDLSEWEEYNLHPKILENLAKLKFTKPTPIQREFLKRTKENICDVIAAAETGSGKTLAFAIPIVNHLLKKHETSPSNTHKLQALILTPTRELAIQVMQHIKRIIQGTVLKVGDVVGGLAPSKQKRILSYRPNIIVATTGRYWDFIQKKEDKHLLEVEQLEFLVLDEADRMIAEGHFPELQKILEYISDTRETFEKRLRIQKYVVSATMTLPSKWKEGRVTKRRRFIENNQETIDELMNMLNIEVPEIIDLTPETRMAQTLLECQIKCLNEEKNMYLYYFFLLYPGKTVVFVNSIEIARRIHSLFRILKVPVHILHSKLQQKQRLKNLDKFKANPNAILIATDVAARGLDIPDVKYVVHYQLPRSAEMYVHRAGRAGRAMNEGVSLALVGPSDKRNYTNICLATGKENGIPPFDVDLHYFGEIKKRLAIAKKIEGMTFHYKKRKTEASWYVKAAEEMDIELDEEFHTGIKQNAAKDLHRDHPELKKLEEELKKLLKVPIRSKKLLSKKFLTMNDFENIDFAISAPGTEKDAIKEMKKKVEQIQKKPKPKPPKVNQEEANEELPEEETEENETKEKEEKKSGTKKKPKLGQQKNQKNEKKKPMNPKKSKKKKKGKKNILLKS